MEELTAERKRLLPIFKDISNDLNIEYEQEDFDVRQFFNEIMSAKRTEIQQQKEKRLFLQLKLVKQQSIFLQLVKIMHKIENLEMNMKSNNFKKINKENT